MLSKSISNSSIYIEFYSLVYSTLLILGILVFSMTSTYKQKSVVYLSDISTYTRFKVFLLKLFFFFCLVGGIPPFLTFITKFYIFAYTINSSTIILLLIFIVSLLVYYLSIFKYIRVDFNYNKIIEVISYNSTYLTMFFIFFNLIASYSIHTLCIDLS